MLKMFFKQIVLLSLLANILIATDEGRLRLSATNLELGITCWIGAKIHEEGSTT